MCLSTYFKHFLKEHTVASNACFWYNSALAKRSLYRTFISTVHSTSMATTDLTSSTPYVVAVKAVFHSRMGMWSTVHKQCWNHSKPIKWRMALFVTSYASAAHF